MITQKYTQYTLRNLLSSCYFYFCISFLLSEKAWAQTQSVEKPSTLEMLIVPIGFIVLMYIVFIRPQATKLKEQKTFLESLEKGAAVITTGGLLGKIEQIHETTVELNLGCGKVKVLKEHIVRPPKVRENIAKNKTS